MLNTIFILITIIWLFEFIIKKSPHDLKSTASTFQEKISLRLIMLAILIIIIISIFTASEQISPVWNWIGLIIYFTGVLLRWWGIHKLGHYFTRNVIVHSQMELVSTGPYRVLRHPLYTGLLCCILGISLVIGSWIGLIMGILLTVPLLLHRIHIEEGEMLKALGEPYQQWRKARWRLIPFIY